MQPLQQSELVTQWPSSCPQGALATALMPVPELDELHRAASYFPEVSQDLLLDLQVCAHPLPAALLSNSVLCAAVAGTACSVPHGAGYECVHAGRTCA